MVKLSILTYQYANNYGAVLQAYALKTVLEELGGEVEFLPFETVKQYENNALWKKNSGIKGMLYNLLRLPYFSERRKRVQKFEKFRYKYLKLDVAEECEKVMEEIGQKSIICGSDQIWNPNAPDFEPFYYRVIEKARKVILYAVSTGNATTEDLKPYAKYFHRLETISTREESSHKLFYENGYKGNIFCHADPVFLLPRNKWLELVQKNENEKYILCYFLRRKYMFRYYRYAKKMARKLNCKIKFINVNFGLFSYTHRTLICDAGPVDFLNLIYNAQMILTNSFHATAFSMIFHKPFYNLEMKDGTDSRIKGVLQRVGLEGRRILADHGNLVDVGASSEIDPKVYGKVEEQIHMLRKESLTYLRSELEREDRL